MALTGDKLNKAHAKVTDKSQSAMKRYQHVVVGSTSMLFLLRFELVTMLFGGMYGAAGLWFRQKAFCRLFKRVGRGVVFGRNLTIRHPRKIEIGDNVVISDGCVLDAVGEQNRGIRIGDGVMMGQNAMLRCKNGDIDVGARTGLGANSAVYATGGNHVRIGSDALIAPFVYIGGGQYHHERTDVPIVEQGANPRGGNEIGDGVWLGARVTVIDGAHVGRDTIVSAGSMVMHELPGYAIAGGVPARVVRMRDRDEPVVSESAVVSV